MGAAHRAGGNTQPCLPPPPGTTHATQQAGWAQATSAQATQYTKGTQPGGGRAVCIGASGGCGGHKGAANCKGRGGRRDTRNSTGGTGCSPQPLRHPLCCRGAGGTVGPKASGASTGAQRQVVLQGGQLLPAPAHIRGGYQRVGHSGSMGAQGLGWHRFVQGGHRPLQQGQGGGRGGHDYIAGGLAPKAPKGPAKGGVQNRVPANPLGGLLQAM